MIYKCGGDGRAVTPGAASDVRQSAVVGRSFLATLLLRALQGPDSKPCTVVDLLKLPSLTNSSKERSLAALYCLQTAWVCTHTHIPVRLFCVTAAGPAQARSSHHRAAIRRAIINRSSRRRAVCVTA